MKISIITASYNYELLIARAIESIISQSYKNWELIIVDDGSKDNSIDVIKNYTDKYSNIKLYHHENYENKGLKETIKLGLENCTGEFIAFLESDDYWENNYLEEKIKIIEEYPDIKFIFNDVKLFGDEECVRKLDSHFEIANEILNTKRGPNNLFNYFFMLNLIPTFSCAMVEKTVLVTECNFDTPIDALLDWWLWTQIASKNKIYYIDKKLTNWMIHCKSYLNTSDEVAAKEKQIIFKKQMFKLIKSSPGCSLFLYIKISIMQLAMIRKIEKIFRGLIRRILIIME